MHQIPWLRQGYGNAPANGGCIMQVIDWISTGGFSDRPSCVNPALQVIAIKTNDLSSDEDRQKLLDLAPRLMGTSEGGPEVHRALAEWAVSKARHASEARLSYDHPLVETATKWMTAARAETNSRIITFDYECSAISYATVAFYAVGGDAIDFLCEALDEYDRLTGRTEKVEITPEQWAGVCEVMKAA